jgi:O-antigen/teichoic acid export membrane protein
MGLTRQVATFVSKFSYVLTPTASSLHAGDRREELQRLLVDGSRFAAYLTMPPMMFLAVLGSPVLQLWMGPGYGVGLLVAIVAMGQLLAATQQPAWSVLVGMNAHGRVALAALASAFVAVGLCYAALGPLGLGLEGAAVAIAVLTFVNGVYATALACRRLDLSSVRYLVGAWRGPFFCAVPLLAVLFAVRSTLRDRPLACVVAGVLATALTLGPLYWKVALPPGVRERIRRLARAAVLRRAVPAI